MIEIKEAPINNTEKDILKKIDKFDKIIFTSKNGVIFFFKQYYKITGNQVLPIDIKFATIGKNTSKELEKYAYKTDFTNKGSTSFDFIKNINTFVNNNENVLLALGNLSKNVIEEAILKYANVCRINFYNTTATQVVDNKIVEQIKNNNYNLLLFTSPSGFYNFNKLRIDKKNLKIACIGTTTANAIKKHNITPLIIAKKSTAEGFAESIINYFKK